MAFRISAATWFFALFITHSVLTNTTSSSGPSLYDITCHEDYALVQRLRRELDVWTITRHNMKSTNLGLSHIPIPIHKPMPTLVPTIDAPLTTKQE